MSLLTMVQKATDMIGINRPSAVVNSQDPTIKQLLSIAQVEGTSLSQRGEWAVLTQEASFETVVDQSAYPLKQIAPDFDRMVGQTLWSRSGQYPLQGPMTPSAWQGGQVNQMAAPFKQFRLRGGDLLIHPTPAAVEQIHFEYQSANWCQSSLGNGQSSWQADDDTGLLDESLMLLGIIWRFKQAKGFAFQMELMEYEKRVSAAMGRSGGAAVLNLVSHGGGLAEATLPESIG
uniref:Uncharacterized protein n=1 Tax=Magnetococcus massalia (strain MO-1) TaxID=451514 RepID=A0A1S7LEX7_MAGMO|nr:conserved protein of unknown function [Candidatus Magnetococcus massalia]